MATMLTITYGADWLIIPPSPSTTTSLLRATTLTRNGKPVAGKGESMPTLALTAAQVTFIRNGPANAKPQNGKAGRLTLPVAKRGRKPSSRATGADYFAATVAKVRAPRVAKVIAPAQPDADA